MIPVLAVYAAIAGGSALLYSRLSKKKEGKKLFGDLPAHVAEKAASLIKTSQDPQQLHALGDGLTKAGAPAAGDVAHQKANIVEQQQAPFAAALTKVMVSPPTSTVSNVPTSSSPPPVVAAPSAVSVPATAPVGVPSAGVVATLAPTKYKVASGDAPASIAKRFGVSLVALASANGKAKANILQGKIAVGQVLSLPVGSRDSGPASKAKGITS